MFGSKKELNDFDPTPSCVFMSVWKWCEPALCLELPEGVNSPPA